MSQLSLANLILAARRTVNDTGTGRSSLVTDEQMGGINGSSKRFSTLYNPIVAGTFEVRLNGAVKATPGDYSVDLVTGLLTMVVAPVVGPPMDILEVTYRFQWFADAEYEEFLSDSATNAGFPPTGTTMNARATSVAANYPDDRLDALLAYVGYRFNMRRADEFAHRFASSSAGTSVNVDVVTKNFRDMATKFLEDADSMRDNFYKRRGAREAPAAGVASFQPPTGVTGPQGTPRR